MKTICWLAAMLFAMGAPQCWAVACTVNAGGVSFGGYDPFSSLGLDGTGNIAVTCDVSAPYTIGLSPGNGPYASRTMLSGAHTLTYNLFTDGTRTGVWGDGTGSTGTVSGNGSSANHTVYGRIPARQNAHVGTYSDIITVTVTF